MGLPDGPHLRAFGVVEVLHHEARSGHELLSEAADEQRQVRVLREVARRDRVEGLRNVQLLGGPGHELHAVVPPLAGARSGAVEVLLRDVEADHACRGKTVPDHEDEDSGPAGEVEDAPGQAQLLEHPLFPDAVLTPRRGVHDLVVDSGGAPENRAYPCNPFRALHRCSPPAPGPSPGPRY
jgi:hypothetical protein